MDFNCSGKEKENKGISNVTILHCFTIHYTDLTCIYELGSIKALTRVIWKADTLMVLWKNQKL